MSFYHRQRQPTQESLNGFQMKTLGYDMEIKAQKSQGVCGNSPLSVTNIVLRKCCNESNCLVVPFVTFEGFFFNFQCHDKDYVALTLTR